MFEIVIRVPFIREGIYQSIPQNEARLSSKFELVGVDILDVGCGGGILSEVFKIHYHFLSYLFSHPIVIFFSMRLISAF